MTIKIFDVFSDCFLCLEISFQALRTDTKLSYYTWCISNMLQIHLIKETRNNFGINREEMF